MMYNVLTFLKFRAIITIITVQVIIITYQQNKNEHWWNFAWGKMKKAMTIYRVTLFHFQTRRKNINNLDR